MQLDIEKPEHWLDIVSQSGLKVKTVCRDIGINATRFRKWVYGYVQPNKKSKEKLLEALEKMLEVKKTPISQEFWLCDARRV